MFKNITEGVDLTHPKASVGYIIPAVVAVMVLLAIVAAGSWIYKTVTAKTAGLTTGATSTIGSLAPGTFGDGS